METRKCLLIIDMQNGSFTAESKRYDPEGIVKRINELSAQFRANDLPVIFIQHNGTRLNEYIPDTHEWQILSDLHVGPTDLIIEKEAHDSFYNTALESRLSELNVTELVITGSATDFCVESTVQAALSKDYNIIVVEDGHTAGDRPHLAAEQIVRHYNWIWGNMIPTEGKIEVIKSEAVIALLD
ncbi:cysteine hydrolase [Dyadobacter chenwenxiniae]|uniref:Cysteine hydrolase n=1 Tax=Dyadobacter chenwenxiniae TaxID=2906456 RepID=A0A9X1PM58_9BACT|nr:cysteine hydrolase family protein [Dyadobacter chenwenxiniae]MCF0063376.1 cysteine hydrolase [Dyadobacter chenwenxiniae]UON85245.1 cysteine hydrolase [Dyadobacter chenwenxiniae]